MPHTEIDVYDPKTKLLWLDFEFTGLNTDDDIILETGLVVTDFRLTKLASYTTFVSDPEGLANKLMERNPWWEARPPHKRVMLDGVQNATKDLSEVEAEIVNFAQTWCTSPIILAGNSIYNDRKWIDRDFPRLSQELHYRMIDVSTIKLLGLGLLGISYDKDETHRALDDINESIAELRYLLQGIGGSSLIDLLGQGNEAD